MEEEMLEHQAVEERKKIRLAPTFSFVRRLVVITVTTVVLLWVGFYISSHISIIVERFTEGGM